jgi:hypothetical protein
LKTRSPLILTARISEIDLDPFDVLRKKHFPPDRNFLRAHLTMFHRLPGEHIETVIDELRYVCNGRASISAAVVGLRNLGAGVAFDIVSPALEEVRTALKAAFIPWLGSQDMQRWRPHITIQNKAARSSADALCRELGEAFRPSSIEIVGLDLWVYLQGPWRHEASIAFATGV